MPYLKISLPQKFLATLRPFYDFRVLMLLALCFGIGYAVGYGVSRHCRAEL